MKLKIEGRKFKKKPSVGCEIMEGVEEKKVSGRRTHVPKVEKA